MAMDVGGSKGGVKSDINVTPLVDVMLVLLIIMMLVAPMLQKGVDVKLPGASNTTDKPDVQGQTTVGIGADKQHLSSTPCRSAPTELTQKVADALEKADRQDGAHQGRPGRGLRHRDGDDGRAPRRRRRRHGADHRAQGEKDGRGN